MNNSSFLKIETTCFSQILLKINQATLHHTPEDNIFYSYYRVKFKSYTRIGRYLKMKIWKLFFFPKGSSLTRSYIQNAIRKLRPKLRCTSEAFLFYKVTAVSWNTNQPPNTSIILTKIIWITFDLWYSTHAQFNSLNGTHQILIFAYYITLLAKNRILWKQTQEHYYMLGWSGIKVEKSKYLILQCPIARM